MNETKYFERLTEDNAILAMINHQTGLLVNCRGMDFNFRTLDLLTRHLGSKAINKTNYFM